MGRIRVLLYRRNQYYQHITSIFYFITEEKSLWDILVIVVRCMNAVDILATPKIWSRSPPGSLELCKRPRQMVLFYWSLMAITPILNLQLTDLGKDSGVSIVSHTQNATSGSWVYESDKSNYIQEVENWPQNRMLLEGWLPIWRISPAVHHNTPEEGPPEYQNYVSPSDITPVPKHRKLNKRWRPSC